MAAHARALVQRAAQHDELRTQQLTSACQACYNLTSHLPLSDVRDGAEQELVARYLHNAMQLTQACLAAGGACIDNATDWQGQTTGALAAAELQGGRE